MDSKLKAKELYHKHFSMITIESPIDRVSSIPYVKKCALIAVDEILQQILWDKAAVKYWNEVKKEIEKL